MATTPTRTLPADWIEVPSNSANEINPAFALLRATFPKRYDHLGRGGALPRKMNHNRPTTAGADRFSLRIFRRKKNNVVDMCAFFFLRLHDVEGTGNEAYCLTVGVMPNVTARALYDDLVEVCGHMKGLTNDMKLNIVNAEVLPDDLNDTPGAQVVKNAFDIGKNGASGIPRRLRQESNLTTTKCPWPSDLVRWEIYNL
jgi:hypothetical protein